MCFSVFSDLSVAVVRVFWIDCVNGLFGIICNMVRGVKGALRLLRSIIYAVRGI